MGKAGRTPFRFLYLKARAMASERKQAIAVLICRPTESLLPSLPYTIYDTKCQRSSFGVFS